MNCLVRLFVGLCIFQISAYGQNTYTLQGTVSDENGHTLPGATVALYPGNIGTVCNAEGEFVLSELVPGKYELTVSFLGYIENHQHIELIENTEVSAKLSASAISLQEVVVACHHDDKRKTEESLALEIVNEKYLKQNLGGSLMQSLERLPGITTIDIGSGQSKPVIRGLGFNRVVVVENGIKHESQQWGADHGLEIDQYASENVEIIKGPASLTIGSDAIGGVIDIKQDKVPPENSLQAQVDLTAKSNNNFGGTSFSVAGRKKAFYAGLRATLLSYADYKVPLDTVEIFPDTYSYKIALTDNRLRNTAGHEYNFHGHIGILLDNFRSRIYVSQFNSKGGFFANAHGLEPLRVDAAKHDKSFRDILYPYQEVGHLKVTNKTQWHLNGLQVDLGLGYQHNIRKEWSQYTSHGYMPVQFPDELPFSSFLERAFNKEYYSANLKVNYDFNEKIAFSAGLNLDWQQNNISGRGFIIPAFSQINQGGYILAKYSFSDISVIRVGGRYDFGKIRTHKYFDWYKSVVTSGSDIDSTYLQRASELNRGFSNISWSVGYIYNPQNWLLKLNVGKSFRIPTPHELASNGINYHFGRYELGDTNLSPEVSLQFDVGIEFRSKKFAVGTSPFINYFPNYIYLNPTSEFNRQTGAGHQEFYYTQSSVFRYGAEVHAHYELLKSLRLGILGEYVYSEQLSGEKKGYTLPYSPAPAAIVNLKYQRPGFWHFEYAYISIDYRITGTQNNVVPPEDQTPGSQIINVGLGCEARLFDQKLEFSVQAQNLFNTPYFNHTSFYRGLNIPEPGRNFIVNLSIPISKEN